MLKFYAAADKADLQELALLFENIDLLYQYKEKIFTNPDYYFIPINGLGVFALYAGTCRLRLGEMLRLWESSEWKIGDTYNYNIVGSPLSGSNVCSAWIKGKGFSQRHHPSFGGLAHPAWKIVNERQDISVSNLNLRDLLSILTKPHTEQNMSEIQG